MSEIKRGTAMLLLTSGDEQISTALADGILAARLPAAKPLEQEQREAVSAEIDRQKIADYLRVAMHREPVDYAALAFDAEMRYGQSMDEPGAMKRAAEKLLVGYAMLCMAFHSLFSWVGTEG